jgi:hypothetical protein
MPLQLRLLDVVGAIHVHQRKTSTVRLLCVKHARVMQCMHISHVHLRLKLHDDIVAGFQTLRQLITLCLEDALQDIAMV